MIKRTKTLLLSVLLCFTFIVSISFYINTTKAEAAETPTVQLYVGSPDNIVSSGTIANHLAVVVSTPGTVFVRLPNQQTGSRFIETNYKFGYTLEGLYTIYRFTPQNNPSNYVDLDIQITLYTTPPSIVLYENDISVDNNSFVKGKINATVTFGLSGKKFFEVSKSGTGFVTYNNESLSADGVYEFRAVDMALNESTATITKDTIKPVVEVFSGDTLLNNNAITNGSIEIKASDNLSGINNIYVILPNSTEFTCYNQTSIQFTESGNYEVYASDKSGNVSDIVKVTLDNIVPVVSIESDGAALVDNSFINVNSIMFKVNEINAVGYVYKTSKNETSIISNGATFSEEDTYTFYAVDTANNKSSEITVTIDRTAPVGNFYANGVLTTAPYINSASFYYTANDKNSFTVYVKEPNKSNFVVIENSKIFSAEGCYSFYIEDAAKNQSAVQTITVDRVKPTLTLYANTTATNSGSFVKADYISTVATDDVSGIKTIFVKLPSSSSYSVYIANTKLTIEGLYQFFCEDAAGNLSDTKTIHLDNTAPIGTLYANGTMIISNSHTNKAFSYTAIDNSSGISKLEIKKPNGIWETYVAGTEIKSGSEGTYFFRAYDLSGNVSDESAIIYDLTSPVVLVYAGASVISNSSFVNADYIMFSVTDLYLDVCYIKLPNESDFKKVNAGVQYSVSGKYEFYAVDKSENQSEIFVITLDKVKPVGTLLINGVEVAGGSFTNKAFNYDAIDSLSGIVRLEIKKPNGTWETYIAGTIISGTDGTYCFRAFDGVGNISLESVITLDTIAPNIQVLGDGTAKSNNSYTNAATLQFTAFDINLADCYIKLPNESEFIKFFSGSAYTIAGKYEFYAVDKSNNQSEIFTITLDKAAPVGTITADNKTIGNGEYINKPFKYNAVDDYSGIDRMEIKKPNGAWELYIAGTFIGSGNADGLIFFRYIDNVGNVSDESFIYYDTTAPTVTIYAVDTVITSYSFSNAEYVCFKAEDISLIICYIKLPNETEFRVSNTGEQFTAEGRYEYFAVDEAGNQTEIFVIVIDKTRPVGTITADGISLPNGKCINKPFKCNATDDRSGIARMEIKKPNGAWEVYIAGTTITGIDGLFYFRAYDAAGNSTDELFIVYDTTPPAVEIYAGTAIKANDSFVNADYIAFVALDLYFETCYIKLPNETEFKETASGFQFTAAGKYEFFAVDKSNNVSIIYSITLDKVKPIGFLFVDNTQVGNDTYTNKNFWFEGFDEISGIDYCEIKRPDGIWEVYIAGTVISSLSINGKYLFRCIDKVGNVSLESIINLDTVAPVGSLFAEDKNITSGEFTNALRISFICMDNELAACYIKLPNSVNFITTSSGALYSAVGKYEFYAVDAAGNVSILYTLIIDRTPKTVTLNNVTDNSTNQNVSISWKDTIGLAPIISVTVNGFSVLNNSLIATINGGKYEVLCLDSAGNIWGYNFTASRVDIETTTSNKYWWEAKDENKNAFAFETYDKALAFSEQREKALVKTLTWNGDTWDTGYIMDSIDSVNAKQGAFYIYKKHDNPNIEVAYFTLTRLNAVIRSYAEKDIIQYYYWQKTPAQSYDNNDIYKPFTSGKITAKSITLRSSMTYKIDGVVMSGTSYSVTGNHVLTVYDDYGNSYSYELAIVSSAPDLEFRYGNGDYYAATTEQPYYLKNRITIKVVDKLDEFAMVIVKNSKGEILYTINLGEELIITEAGKYIIQTVNHNGTKDYVFYISYNSPSITTKDNSTNKRFEVTVTPSTDRDMQLLNISIYHSTDGVVWTLLTTDDYGLTVSINNLKYSFYKSGYYKIVVEDICRSGIDAIVYETYYEKPAPVGNLNGVNDNGYSNSEVSFSWTDEAYANLFIDGLEIEYTSGTVLTEEGSYRLIFRDLNGYEKEYVFVIDKTAAAPVVSEEINNGYVSNSISVTWEKEDVTSLLFINGVQVGDYEKGTELNADGHYKIMLMDLANNISTLEFTIDTTAPTAELKGVENGGKTKSDVKLVNLSKAATVTAYFNGTEFAYRIGDTMNKTGSYKILLTDEAGNVTEYSFEILYSVNSAGIIFIIIFIAAIVGTTVLTVIMRKKSKFKSKNKQKSGS